jgi:GT2 family glycosyltransferase
MTLRKQAFEEWEAYVASLPSDSAPHVRVCEEGLSEIEQCRQALEKARGRYFIVVPPRVSLHPQALWLLANAVLNDDAPTVVYTDSDRIDPQGNRVDPRLRTGWDPDLALGCDATGPVYAVRTDDARKSGGYRAQSTLDAVLYDLLLRVTDRALPGAIRHLPAVLWHGHGWLDRDAMADGEAVRSVVRRNLFDRGLRASVDPAFLLPGANRIGWAQPSPPPLVTVIVPIRDRADLLLRCAEGVLHRTSYEPLELLIVDNGSVEPATHRLLAELAEDNRVRVLSYPGAFNFPAINNFAVGQARGKAVVFLNNDTDVIGREWLSELVSQVMRPDVGAAGAKLLYADGRVQHCGVSIGPDGALGHQYRFADRYEPGPLGELALARTVMAVTGACLAIRTAVFWEVGGFDEERFAVAFNDVDLCLRLGDFGYRIVCTPFAELFHLESTTRGLDDTPEKLAVAKAEFTRFRELWDAVLDGDAFHNPHVIFHWNDVTLRPPRASLVCCNGEEFSVGLDAEGLGREPRDIDAAEAENVSDTLLRARAVARTRDARRYAMRLQDEVRLLRDEVRSLQGEATALRLEVEQQRTAFHAELAAAAAERQVLETAHQQVLQSTIWRASWPARRMGEALPSGLRQTITDVAAFLWRGGKPTKRD